MIWFSAESAVMLTRESPCGPSAIPASRKIATSGIRIRCATNAASVPTARISPQESSVCLAISIELDAANARSVLNVDDPAFSGSSPSRPGQGNPDRSFRSRRVSIQSFQPGRDLAHGDVGLVQELAHREEAVELAGQMQLDHSNARFLQPRGIFVAFVTQG